MRYRPYIFHKSNSWWIIDGNVKWKPVKLPEEKIKYLGELRFGTEILYTVQKVRWWKNKKLNHIKIKKTLLLYGKRMQIQDTDNRKYLQNTCMVKDKIQNIQTALKMTIQGPL